MKLKLFTKTASVEPSGVGCAPSAITVHHTLGSPSDHTHNTCSVWGCNLHATCRAAESAGGGAWAICQPMLPQSTTQMKSESSPNEQASSSGVS
eukprot:811916-Prymnesium_polylepis.1